jgi:hypothetical protein
MTAKPGPVLTQKTLKEFLRYNPDTGLFTWRVSWYEVNSGDVAGNLQWKQGKPYVEINLKGKRYAAHRLAWFYVYGQWPKESIDHIDRDGTNNRLSNLIEADESMQRLNANLRSNNTSGHVGVHWWVTRGKWQAYIMWKYKRLHLGNFDNLEDAVAARKAAEVKLLGCTCEELQDPANRRIESMKPADDRKLSTYRAHAEADAELEMGGRYSKLLPTTVTGAMPGPVFPHQPATSPFASDPVPAEPPLGYCINDLEPVGETHEIERSKGKE